MHGLCCPPHLASLRLSPATTEVRHSAAPVLVPILQEVYKVVTPAAARIMRHPLYGSGGGGVNG